MLHITAPRPDRRIFIHHLPSHTLAELLIAAGPGTAHVLRIPSALPPDHSALAAIAAHLRSAHPLAAEGLTIYSRPDIADIPDNLILFGIHTPGILIHRHTLGFTAGITARHQPIPPHWRDHRSHTPAARSAIIAAAASTLAAALASLPQMRAVKKS